MHHAERRVAVRDALHQHPERDEIVHLIELDVLPAHLPVDAVEVLHPAGDVDGEAALDQHLLQAPDDVRDVALAVPRRPLHLALHVGVGLGAQELEAQILELGLEPVDAEAPGEGRVDLHGFVGDALLRVHLHVLEGPHVVQSVSELHEKDTNVSRHRHEHLAEALRLLVFLTREIDAAELGDPVDEEGDLVAEELGDLLVGGVRVLDRVVEERRADAPESHEYLDTLRSAAQTLAVSSFMSAMIPATLTGWMK